MRKNRLRKKSASLRSYNLVSLSRIKKRRLIEIEEVLSLKETTVLKSKILPVAS